MSYLVLAARQLVKQVRDLIPGAEVQVLPEVDGLGMCRSIRFDPVTARKIGQTLDVINDPRIASIVRSSRGVKVTFVSDTRADRTHPFDVAEVHAVLNEE